MREEISKEEAKSLIEESDRGILVVKSVEEIPVIGEVKPEDRKVKVDAESYLFGRNDDS